MLPPPLLKRPSFSAPPDVNECFPVNSPPVMINKKERGEREEEHEEKRRREGMGRRVNTSKWIVDVEFDIEASKSWDELRFNVSRDCIVHSLLKN